MFEEVKSPIQIESKSATRVETQFTVAIEAFMDAASGKEADQLRKNLRTWLLKAELLSIKKLQGTPFWSFLVLTADELVIDLQESGDEMEPQLKNRLTKADLI